MKKMILVVGFLSALAVINAVLMRRQHDGTEFVHPSGFAGAI